MGINKVIYCLRGSLKATEVCPKEEKVPLVRAGVRVPRFLEPVRCTVASWSDSEGLAEVVVARWVLMGFGGLNTVIIWDSDALDRVGLDRLQVARWISAGLQGLKVAKLCDSKDLVEIRADLFFASTLCWLEDSMKDWERHGFVFRTGFGPRGKGFIFKVGSAGFWEDMKGVGFGERDEL